MSKRFLLLSAYDAQSHSQWRITLKQLFADYDWTQLSLPPRHFNWRVRGNSLSWGFGHRACLAQNYDLLIATSMVDLSSLRGFIPSLAQIPSIVYFHENQFAYPQNNRLQQDQPSSPVDAQLTSIYSALCANSIVFNSQYNKESFLTGAQHLLSKLPDFVPDGLMEQLKRAIVIPVPLASNLLKPHEKETHSLGQSEILNVAWNHRREYDKGPELLLQLVEAVCQRKLPIKFSVFGQQFRNQPDEFVQVGELLEDYGAKYPHLKPHLGYVKNQHDYFSRLRDCDVVLSTSFHDFQGLSILEACALGCTPLTPSALVYPEYFDKKFTYTVGRELNEFDSLNEIIQRLKDWSKLKASGAALPKVDVTRFSPDRLKKDYLALFNNTFKSS